VTEAPDPYAEFRTPLLKEDIKQRLAAHGTFTYAGVAWEDQGNWLILVINESDSRRYGWLFTQVDAKESTWELSDRIPTAPAKP